MTSPEKNLIDMYYEVVFKIKQSITSLKNLWTDWLKSVNIAHRSH